MERVTDKELERIGKRFGWGLLTAFSQAFLIGLVMVGIYSAAREYFRWDYDGTDDALAGERSGMRLTTDYGTGCQYLSTAEGGMTPRLDATGKPICR